MKAILTKKLLLGAQAMKTSELTGPAPAQHGADTTKLIEMLYRWDLDKGRLEYWFQNAWVPYEELGDEIDIPNEWMEGK